MVQQETRLAVADNSGARVSERSNNYGTTRNKTCCS